MRNIKKFENLFISNTDDENIIKDILIELKDEYPEITGNISGDDISINNRGYIKIEINRKNKEVLTIDDNQIEIKYRQDLINISKRLQIALNKEVRISNILGDDIILWVNNKEISK